MGLLDQPTVKPLLSSVAQGSVSLGQKVAPALSKAFGTGLEIGKNLLPPASFAKAAVSNILSFAMGIAPAILVMGAMDMVVRGDKSNLGGALKGFV